MPEVGQALEVTDQAEDDFQEVPSTGVRFSHGRGVQYLDNDYLEQVEASLGPRVCWRF